VVLTLMPKLGALDRKQVACLAGLAPFTRQSGQWQGKAIMGSDRKHLCDALYMPVLVAMRCNPDLKAKCERLRAAGKSAKVAIVAIMRKLIDIAHALVKADRKWASKAA
jgi:transposase